VSKSLGVESDDLARALVDHAPRVCEKCGACTRLLQALLTYLREAEQSDEPTNLSKEFALEAVRWPARHYTELPESHKLDVDIAVEAVKHCWGLFPDHLPGNVRWNFEVMVTAVQRNEFLMYRLLATDRTRVSRELERRA
ncbi:unnamed protein product, partial [Symbiodinium necroappetens]